ncbi:hypothetical protein ElyMa_001115400 [Elysia marginata]|uniref:Uncharacterized protein n=1 Tax=Elysia marginata TaxID=1093978 RepID=A0AAV4HVY4_9GAST|nr:hypothetical protein ElyMa_001115400 [Elysia marginata]
MILTHSSQRAGKESDFLVADSLVSARRFSTTLYIQGIMRSQSEAGLPLAHITLGKRGESLAPQRRRQQSPVSATEAPLFPKVIRASGIPASDWPKSQPSGIPASDWLLKAHQAKRPNRAEALPCPQSERAGARDSVVARCAESKRAGARDSVLLGVRRE